MLLSLLVRTKGGLSLLVHCVLSSPHMLDTFLPFSVGPLRGTHGSVEHFAHLLARDVLSRGSLPSLTRIRLFSGLLGPDVAWARGRLTASHSRYVPSVRLGGAVDAIMQYFDRLSEADVGSNALYEAAGWLSHLVGDLVDPAHQVGRPGHVITQFWGRALQDDWVDPLTGSLLSKRDRHNRFEWTLATTRTPGSREHTLAYLRRLRDEYLGTLSKFPVAVVLHGAAERVEATGAWAHFLASGDTPSLRRTLRELVIPLAPALIAALWITALKR